MTIVNTPSRNVVTRLGASIGCTEGQVYTFLIGVVVAVLLGATGLPPVFRDGPVFQASASPVGTSAPPIEDATPLEDRTLPTVGGAETSPIRTQPPRSQTTGRPTPASGSPSFDGDPPAGAEARPDSQRTLAFGAVTLLAEVEPPGAPHGVAVTSDGHVVVATNNGTTQEGSAPSEVHVYTTAGMLDRRFAVEGQPEERLEGLTGLALDADGAAIVLDASTARVLRLDLSSGAQSPYGTIPDIAACLVVGVEDPCEPGIQDQPPRPSALAFDPDGRLLVADSGQATVWIFDHAGADARPWLQSLDYASGNGVTGIAFDSSSSMLLTVATGLHADNPLGGEVYRVGVAADGSAGEPRVVAHLDRGDAPTGVAAGPDHAVYIVLSAANAVLVLESDGSERARFTTEATDEVTFDRPSSAVVWGSSLLVTNQSTSLTPERAAIFEIGTRR